ncbi:MAG: hypothetical protein ACR2NA_01190 [Solirubrobacterales bacterium]
MPRLTVGAATALLALMCLLLGSAVPAADARVPRGFVGVTVDGPMTDSPISRSRWRSETGLMVRNGVETIRVAFRWKDMQPYATLDDVPTDERSRYTVVKGVPTDFSETDIIVAEAVRRRLAVLPVVAEAPGWAAAPGGVFVSRPADPNTYGRFLYALSRRYGTYGSFWRENPTLPRHKIREWQVWNEPSLTNYWQDQPFAKEFVRLLRSANRYLSRGSSHATIVLAGLPDTSWIHLRAIYKAGGRRYFDAVAVHPFSRRLANAEKIVRLTRRVMDSNGDRRKKIFVTETTWTSAKGKIPASSSFGIEVSERGQAGRARAVLRRFASRRRSLGIDSVYWATWMRTDSDPVSNFDYSGLRSDPPDGPVRSKPALAAFGREALRLEGCRSKGSSVTSCRR